MSASACASDPDVHLAVTRRTNQKVTLQLCDPASPATPCKTTELFEAADSLDTVKTIDIFVDDTPELILQFTLATPNFCTQVGLVLDAPIEGRVSLPADASSLSVIEGCVQCTPESCE